MLKHKIRKSRKNILSLLESVQQEEETRKENIPSYSEIKKREKKGKDRNVKIGKYHINLFTCSKEVCALHSCVDDSVLANGHASINTILFVSPPAALT